MTPYEMHGVHSCYACKQPRIVGVQPRDVDDMVNAIRALLGIQVRLCEPCARFVRDLVRDTVRGMRAHER